MSETKGNNNLFTSKLAMAGYLGAGLAFLKWANDKYFISKDLADVWKLLKVKRAIDGHLSNKDTIADVWENTVRQYGNKTAILFEDKKYSFRQMDKAANQVAHWARSIGIGKDQVVALYMENKPEYVVMWMGIVKAGGICALINHNVTKGPLIHCLKVSGAKTVIFGTEVGDAIGDIRNDLPGFALYSCGASVNWATHLDPLLAASPTKTLNRRVRKGVTFSDTALLVYTSGTTGLPKAATIKHLRLFSMGFAFATMFEVTSEDIVYTVLPLYHSAGGLCGVGMMMTAGATMALRRKFSSREFWNDCRKYNVTVVQYIGELCRYLLKVPPQPNDGDNKVRIAIGNGLRPDIWPTFQSRFNIPQIGEFYGSTEGNAAMMNHCTDEKSQGAVGRMGPLMKFASKLKVVKFDVVEEEPVRDKDGFLVECGVNEVGELLGEIIDTDPIRGFAGYHGNKKATQKKIIENAFRKGDKYFRTGDLLRHDTNGYWHFVDRIGDTFRWKGENVSTNEVSEVISTFPGMTEVNVYGAAIPGQDGRACMAAAVVDPSIDWKGFAAHCMDNLPVYAVPVFIRLKAKIDITGTFKHQKVALRKEGADPSLVKEPLYYLDLNDKIFKPLGVDQYRQICDGTIRI